MRQVWVVADDFGIAPGVDRAIVELLELGRLSGTGCMTLFAEWPQQAKLLDAQRNLAGLHLTLTDQRALTGASSLAPSGQLPGLSALLKGTFSGRIRAADAHSELDAQLAAFTDAMGCMPAYMDGHQHVHFLPVVRAWLRRQAQSTKASSRGPWLRGAPLLEPPVAKVAVVKLLSTGFDAAMLASGYGVKAPLAGFYDWSKSGDYAAVVQRAFSRLPDGAVFMCHPGEVDGTLKSRDGFTDMRVAEYQVLRSQGFADLLQRHQISVARP